MRPIETKPIETLVSIQQAMINLGFISYQRVSICMPSQLVVHNEDYRELAEKVTSLINDRLSQIKKHML